MASCDQILQLISRELDRDLSPREQEELTVHLAQCPECRTLRQQLAQISRAMGQLDELRPAVPPQLIPEIMDRIREEAGKTPPSGTVPLLRRSQFRALAGVAACAVLCVGLLRLSPLQPSSSDQTEDGIAGQSLPDTSYSPYTFTASEDSSAGEAFPSPRAASPEASLYSAAKAAPETDSSPLTTLILSQLPPGGEELLEGVQWTQQEDGSTSCTVPVQALEQLLQLAREEDLSLQYLPQDSGTDMGLFVLSPQES